MKKRGLVTLLCLCCIGTNLGNNFVDIQTPATKNVAIANAKETKTTKETEKTTKKETLKKLQNNLLLMEILDSSIPEKNYSKKVKRKEFAKLLVNVSVYKDNKKATSASASYSDLSSKSAYAGYVKTAVENEWLTGYLDGTFKPNEGIKVKDATKAILTLLGYSNSDFTGNKVDARMSKFNDLDLNENINKTKNQSLTWQDMLYLLDNLLNTETKEGVIYAKTLGYALNNNGEIDYQDVLKQAMDGPILAEKNWNKSISIKKKNAIVYRNEKSSNWDAIELYDVLYYAENSNIIWAYDNKITGKVTAISPNRMNPETVTIDGVTYPLGNENVIDAFSMDGAYEVDDFVTLFLGVDDEVALVRNIKEYNVDIDNSILLESCAEEPMLATKNWEDTIPVKEKNATVYRNEKLSKWSKIEEYDVLYYFKELNMIWAYDNKVTGKITAISPNQMNPEIITLNGTTYVLGNEEVIDAFSMDGAYGLEDVVTLFLGVNGEVAIAKNLAEYNIDIDYDILLESCMEGPVLAEENWEDEVLVEKETAIVYRDEQLSTWEQIKEYDVLYYSEELNTIWAYDNKVTGKITEISPNRLNPEAVTVAGSTYTLETSEAKNQLSMKGNYNVNDTVTLFLGLDNKVVALKDTVEYNNTIYGAVLETGTMTTTSSSSSEILENYLVLMDTKGRKHTYIYDALEYTVSANTAVEISYLSEGSPVVKKASAPSTSFYGFRVNEDGTEIGNYKIAENATIIDVYQSEYEILSPKELAGVSLNGANILYYSCSEEGIIDEMILYGVSGCGYQYGMITGISKSGKQYTYTYMTKNGTKTTNVDEINPYLNVGTCCRIFEYDLLNTIYFTAIGQQKVTELSESYIKTENFTIIPTNEILVYYTKNGLYYTTTLSKIKNLSKYDVTVYYEDSTTMVKKAHFLVAKNKS